MTFTVIKVFTASTTWIVPDFIVNTGNIVECVGCGGNVVSAIQSGGGAAYASISNVIFSPRSIVTITVDITGSNSSYITMPDGIIPCKAMSAVDYTGATIVGCIGTTIYPGGNGIASGAGHGAPGGGGAGGPHGAGVPGANNVPYSAGGAGGAADGGAVAGGAGGAPFSGGAAGNSSAQWIDSVSLITYGIGSGGGGGGDTTGQTNGGPGGAYGGGAGGCWPNPSTIYGGTGLVVISFNVTINPKAGILMVC